MAVGRSMVARRVLLVFAAIAIFGRSALAVPDYRLTTTDHSIEEVAAGLRAPDVATRLRAVRILRDAGYPEAAGPLSAALSDPDDRVKREAIDAERALFVSTPVARRKKVGFVVEVRTSDTRGDTWAAEKLALLPRAMPAEVLSGLAEAMHSSNPRVRLDALSAFGALALLGGKAAEDAIRTGVTRALEAVKRGNRLEQIAAAGVVGRALEGCGAASRDPGGSLCAEAGTALVETVNSRDPQLRRAAMAALGQLRYPNAAQALADQLSYYQRGPDAEAALQGLAGVGHQTSVDIFKRMFSSPETAMRRLAVEGLARAGSGGDLPDLERLGQSERAGGVLLALDYAFLKLGSSLKPDQLIASLKKPAMRPLALQYLLDLSLAMAPVIADSLRNPDAKTRMLVADVLGFSRDRSVIPVLDAAANDADAGVVRAAKRAIDRIKLTDIATDVAPSR